MPMAQNESEIEGENEGCYGNLHAVTTDRTSFTVCNLYRYKVQQDMTHHAVIGCKLE